MNSIKQKRRSAKKTEYKKRAQRKKKVYKNQVLARRRQLDRARRAHRRREQREHTWRHRAKFRFRVRVVRYFWQLRGQEMKEKEAVRLTYEKYQPRQERHQRLSFSTIRNWVRQVKGANGNYSVLRPKSCRPYHITYQIDERLVGIIFTLRQQKGWGGHRIAAEVKARELGQISGQAVYNLFDRLGLPVKPYALKGKSEGIAYERYERKSPNAQWHIDLKHTRLADGTKAYICVLVDDFSRYALAAIVGTEKTDEFTAQVTQRVVAQAGSPDQIVSDNGLEFTTVWDNSVNAFGHALQKMDIEHVTTSPAYPQANGKAEAFIKTLNRELLQDHTFDTVTDLQRALDEFLTYYNNYRLHTALAWQAPVTRFAGRLVAVRGLAAIPGLEPMAANPRWGISYCDPPVLVTPTTVRDRHALLLVAN